MKKNIFIITLFLVSIFSQHSFASDSVISYLLINNSDEQEIEVVMNKDKMYLPCKYILDYLRIPYKENHVEKSLSFKNATIKNSLLFIDGKQQSGSVYYLKSGISGIKNEYFLSAESLARITGENIRSNPSELLVLYYTKNFKEGCETEKKDYANTFLIKDSAPKIEAHEELTAPVKKGAITLDTIGFSNNSMSDNYSQIYRENQIQNLLFTNNSKISVAGKIKSGEYSVDFGTNTYESNPFAFSGISPKYKNRVGNYDLLLGQVEPWTFGTNSVGTEILGFQFKDHVEKPMKYQDIEGYVDPSSVVNVKINSDFQKKLSTYGGYYTLKDVYYNGKVQNVTVEEITADGKIKEILVKKFKGNEDKMPIPDHDFLVGVNGLQNRLMANNGYIYQSTTKKLVSGVKFKKQLNDKTTFENYLLMDKIIADPMSGTWGQSLFGNRKYLNFTTMRNLNMVEGQTYMGLLSYKNSEKRDSNLYFGTSTCIAQDKFTDDGSGFFLKYDHNYKINKDNLLKGSVFAYSPNFYSAGSSAGGANFMSDRVGASINYNTKIKNTTITSNASRYFSNFGNFYDGGLIGFNELNLVSRTAFKKLPQMTIKINSKNGENSLGKISSGAYEVAFSKRLKCFSFNAGVRENDYSNQYSADGYSSYSSNYQSTYGEVNFPLGKRFGNMTLGHEDVKTTSDTFSDNYKIIRVAYSTPTIKTVNLNFLTGYHYTGKNKGFDFGFGIMKRLKSGSAVSLNYRFNQVPCYIIDNMYIPASVRSSVTLDFSELYGFNDKKIQSIGTGNDTKGFIKASAFLDINKNGIKDKNEIFIENIPIKIENDSNPLLTAKNGKTRLKPEIPGVYKIELYQDELPTLVSCHSRTNPSRYVKIEEDKVTEVSFGVISSVGNLNGTVSIVDEFKNPIRISDIIVSILDQDGKEVNYTNLNDDGTFSISGLSPGKYIVEIDKELQKMYHIIPTGDTSKQIIEIPAVYKDYVNIDNVNLEYTYSP